MPVFVKASRRAKAYVRKRPSIKQLYKSYRQASDEASFRVGGNLMTMTDRGSAKTTRRFNKLYKAIQARGLNPTKIMGNLGTGKYKLR